MPKYLKYNQLEVGKIYNFHYISKEDFDPKIGRLISKHELVDCNTHKTNYEVVFDPIKNILHLSEDRPLDMLSYVYGHTFSIPTGSNLVFSDYLQIRHFLF